MKLLDYEPETGGNNHCDGVFMSNRTFGKFLVKAGETKSDVRITLKAEDLGMWSAPAGEYITEPGTYSIMVGQSSVDPKTVTKSLQVVA